MPANKTRFCPSGHDKDLYGRYRDGSCSECSRLKTREYRKRKPEVIKASQAAWVAKHGKDRNRRYREQNPETCATNNRKQQLRRLGWTYDQYNWQVMAQGCKCAICGQIPETALHADHDHATGKPRALLCGRCNAGLGNLQDKPALLRAAASYVEAFSG